ncbi:MAG: serine hydrolase domain-containing protein [Thermomicrobiales bacterium]
MDVRSFGITGQDGRESNLVRPGTIFQACSISKAVAGVGSLRLVEEGLLALDDDVNQYLTSWQIPANNSWQPSVTPGNF